MLGAVQIPPFRQERLQTTACVIEMYSQSTLLIVIDWQIAPFGVGLFLGYILTRTHVSDIMHVEPMYVYINLRVWQ